MNTFGKTTKKQRGILCSGGKMGHECRLRQHFAKYFSDFWGFYQVKIST